MEKRLIFEENADPVISELIKKYHLEETAQQETEKTYQGIMTKESVIIRFALDVVLNKNFEGGPVMFLSKNLDIKKEQAENLFSDIKSKLTSLAVEVEVEENIEQGDQLVLQKQIAQENKKDLLPPIKKIVQEKRDISSLRGIKKETEKTNFFRKDDSYREPIE